MLKTAEPREKVSNRRFFSTITRLTSHNITVFVHQTSIQTEGFRYLKDGEEVEFEIHESDKGPQAVNVTGPDGTQLERIVGHGGQDDL